MVEAIVYSWFDKAQIDYCDLCMRLYVSFNAWYRQTTGTEFDREGLTRLKKRFVIWDDYMSGRVLEDLRMLHLRINGDTSDWQGLISYWHRIRCQLFHGALMTDNESVKLAYESLNIFMKEIVTRMKRAFTDEDHHRLEEIEQLMRIGGLKSEYLQRVRSELHHKYITAPNLWNVDMTRVSSPDL